MIKEKIDHLDLSNIELPRNLYLPRINSQGFDLNEQDCLQELMEEVDQFSKLSFQAYSKSTSDQVNDLASPNRKPVNTVKTTIG